MNCLWCNEEIMNEINWSTLVFPTKQKNICKRCEENLAIITGSRCNHCSRQSEIRICNDCLWWKNYNNGKDTIVFNYSIYSYNNDMKEIVAKWKYRGDYELGYLFTHSFGQHFRQKFKSKKDVIAVPIPLSEERMQERGFNQASMLASFLPIQTKELLSRVHNEKQSKKSRNERISSQNPFILKGSINNSVILVDDIYTTGTTIRHAADVLVKSGCPEVFTYTLIRS
ncbi:ComF family protein [Ornithinibacillus scapharcae]|uniref:ComF family protein n=1 Tax=Ornithinibacillus scapharcae TaxID=1147159 RepID=UPI000225B3DC|nr:ComF family protein [Ornithinibacillus scapharcae]